ncbi:MAG TPA: hypothetical protein VGM90_19240 [Kofleriaceae bacterium]
MWLGTRAAAAAAIVISLLIALPSFKLGFVTDDQGFRARLHLTSQPAWDSFAFQSGDPAENTQLIRTGRLPWWSAPDLKIHFARPLTGELFALDDSVFGDAAFGYHAHSLLWFVLLLVGVAAFYRRLLPLPAATLALLCFGLAGAHAQGYAWISARHVLVGAAGVAWALALYIRTDSRWRWLALAPLLVGLLGSEAALGGVPLLCALAWTRGHRRDLVGLVAIGVAYVAVYAALGLGTHASGGYHDPLHEPVAFLAVAVARIPLLLGDGVAGVPVALGLTVVALMAIALFGVAWWLAVRGTETFGLLVIAGLVALLPGVAGFPTGRVLIVPDLAFCAVLGVIIARARTSRVTLAFAVLFALLRFAWAPLYSLGEMKELGRRGHRTDRIAREALDLVPAGSRAVLVAASDPFVFLYPRAVAAELSPHSITCWSVLSAAPASHLLTRTGEHAFTLEPRAPLLSGFDMLFRAPTRPFAVGDTVDQCGGTIRVDSVDSSGRPTKLAISYQRALDDPRLAFLVYRDGHLARFAFPAIGASVELTAGR